MKRCPTLAWEQLDPISVSASEGAIGFIPIFSFSPFWIIDFIVFVFPVLLFHAFLFLLVCLTLLLFLALL